MAVFNIVVDDDPLQRGIFAAAVGGAFFGTFMGLFLMRVNRRTRVAVGDVAPDRRVAVLRSAAKGPVPEDPAERAAAARLVAHQLEETRRNRWWTLGVTAAFLLLGGWLAVTSSPWWWCWVAMWCALLGWSLVLPARLHGRLAELQA
ncbi:hypothetical protein KDN32_15305 [Nocardioides sp. J2M5]|uniref:hypothetical protein n=1 Tax=Nocardioides palaemonis TaxID=2829810 RepID=UPI001BA6FC01|nr:hypothetical protein [Nocardioides palaemonis]MBS2939107.1 hypothetical protein [Nocardioides palaemonis]